MLKGNDVLETRHIHMHHDDLHLPQLEHDVVFLDFAGFLRAQPAQRSLPTRLKHVGFQIIAGTMKK